MPFRQAEGSQPVSSAAAALQARAVELYDDGPLKVMDLGCGSGIIALMLGLQRPAWKITGIDVQAPLIELARENAAVNRLGISFISMDLREYHDPDGFELIVGNPP